MSKKHGDLTAITHPLIPRLNGDGVYEVGDRVLAHDAVADEVRAGTIGLISNEGPGKDYMIITYGEAPFDEYFLATRSDLRDDLPDPEDVEQLEEWLERGW